MYICAVMEILLVDVMHPF